MTELLTKLQEQKVKLWREGENLRFSAPKGALTPELRAELAAHKAELLAELDRGSDPITSLSPDERIKGVSLSFAQERLWVLSQMDPNVAAYHIPQCWRIRGPLRHDVLEHSLNELARRHEILRTAFHTGDDGQPVQVVRPYRPRILPLISASAAELEMLASTESARPFDLERGSLWTAILMRFADEDFALVVIWHHLIFDGWSDVIFARELEAFYTAFSGNLPSPLPELPIQYGDFAVWQRQRATPEQLAPHLKYWRQKLAQSPPPLVLHGDRPRPPRQSYRGDLIAHPLPKELWEKAQRLARAEGVTPFMLLLTVFQALMVRQTGETDFCIGSPIAQRPRVECEDLIGFFVNMLPLRIDFSGDPSFREGLRRARSATLEAFEHQEAPFEKIVEEVQPLRQSSHHPIFQVAFVLQPAGVGPPPLTGLKVTATPLETTTAKFDLTLFLEETGGALRALMEYATDQFDSGAITRMLERFELLFAGALNDPDAPLSRIPVLNASERKQILVEWNGAARPFPEDRTIASVFEEWVRKTPDALAITDGQETLTYRVLDVRANVIARHLQSKGVRAGDLVGIHAERSIRFVAGILGILKAGGAYVPLDEKEPEARLLAMKEACGYLLETDPPLAAPDNAPPIPSEAAGDTAAYVLFTSGSTGTPKGVIIPHRAISRLVVNSDYVEFTSEDTVAFASNVCFDAATFEVWGALLNGGKLAIIPRDVLLSPAALEERLVEEGVTVLLLTTSLFNRMAQESPAMFRTVRHLFFGGENADAASVRHVLESGGKPAKLTNAYGPTEAATIAVSQLVENVEGNSVPIGRPIANTQVYVLDAARQPAPVGIPGELYIGGPGLALGYLNEPELTAQRFLNTEFGRIYKTGDRARWTENGILECIGREDSQIKLRGFRIEPGEVEAALLKHPAIRQAVVTIREVSRENALAAYLVQGPDAIPSEKEIREFLQRFVPTQMIPSFFVWLDVLPLTKNGKLDLKALPEPDATSAPLPTALQPGTETESQIAEIWSSLLGRNGFSVKDDFFVVGGHSLLAIQLLSRLREKFGVNIRARQLFDAPTIADLASYIEGHKDAPPAAKALHSLFPLQRGDESRRPLIIIPGGWGGEVEFLAYGQLKMHLGPDQPLYGLRARGADGLQEPHRSMEEMAADYVSEIRTLQPHGPYAIAGECIGSLLAYEVARVIESQGEKVDPLILLDAEQPSTANARTFQAGEKSEKRRIFLETRILQPAREHWEKLSHLSLGQKVSYIAKRVFRRRAKRPENSSVPDERKLLSHYPLLLMQHTLKPYGGRVTLLVNEALHAKNPALGWDKVPAGGLDIHVLPGDHLSYIREHAATAAAKLRELIDRATATS